MVGHDFVPLQLDAALRIPWFAKNGRPAHPGVVVSPTIPGRYQVRRALIPKNDAVRSSYPERAHTIPKSSFRWCAFKDVYSMACQT